MTMRTGSPVRSPCEVLRKINDICQGDNPKDNEIRKLCAECEKKVKIVARSTPRSNRGTWAWENNPGWESDLDIRLADNYLQEGSSGDVGKIIETE